MQGRWIDVDDGCSELIIEGGNVTCFNQPVAYDYKMVARDDGALTVSLKTEGRANEDAFQRANITELVITPEDELHAYNVHFASNSSEHHRTDRWLSPRLEPSYRPGSSGRVLGAPFADAQVRAGSTDIEEQQVSQKALVQVLKDTRAMLARPDNDFSWSRWNESEAAVAEIDDILRRIEAAETITLEQLELLYAPTGSPQEVSINSDWEDTYLKLSSRFDRAIADL
jgi:hypothetical protein